MLLLLFTFLWFALSQFHESDFSFSDDHIFSIIQTNIRTHFLHQIVSGCCASRFVVVVVVDLHQERALNGLVFLIKENSCRRNGKAIASAIKREAF